LNKLDEVVFLLGGPQGSGLDTSSQVLTTAYAYLGYGVYSTREYYSNIVGRHSYVVTRVSADEIPGAPRYYVDVLVAMDSETVFTHYRRLKRGSFLVYDSNHKNVAIDKIPSMPPSVKEYIIKDLEGRGVKPTVKDLVRYLGEEGVTVLELNYKELLSTLHSKYNVPTSRLPRFKSAILVAIVAGLTSLPIDALEAGFRRRFKEKRDIIEQNLSLAEEVVKAVEKEHGDYIELREPTLKHNEYIVVSGNDAVAIGKVIGGLRYQSYYPITPAQDESFFLETYDRLVVDGESYGSILVVQTEDEIAAVTSAIGAALAGVRAATATSGPGFDLMSEALSWAGNSEVPLVVTLYQRAGPSTGLPTRGEQADLFAALFTGHGDFPRIVLASGDHAEALYDSIEALNLAEKYQTVVIHLLDKFIANSIVTLPLPDTSRVKIDRGLLVKESSREIKTQYKRFSLSKVISERIPIGGDSVVWYTGNEHDETGHITEDPRIRTAMHSKRMNKIEIAKKEIPAEKMAILFSENIPDILLVGWGSVKGVAIEASKILEKKVGRKIGYLHIKFFQPFPSEHIKDIIEKVGVENTIFIENNYSAQASKIVSMYTSIRPRNFILKFTGRPIYLEEIVESTLRILDGEERVVLDYGE